MKTKYITKVAILSAIAAIVMFVETPLPLMPPFLKMDLSDVPALIGAFAMGPLAGVLVELIKNLVHITMTMTGGVGEMANLIIGIAFVLPAGLIYKYKKSFAGAIAGILTGGLFMALLSCMFNYYVTIPLYDKAGFPISEIIALCNKVNPKIHDMKSLIVAGIFPFNLIKAGIVGLVTVLVYKKISPILHK